MKTRVHVAGLGVISAIGTSVESNFSALRNSSSGISHLSLFDSIHKGILPVGQIGLSNSKLAELLSLREDLSRTALLGIHAARESVKNSRIDLSKWRTGLISATTVGGMDKTENFFDEYVNDHSKGELRNVVNHQCGKSTELIAHDLGITQFISTINTACSSSANAIALGSRMIDQGLLDIVVAGGTDSLTRFTLNGFSSLMILDSQPCRPFDANRNGLNLGEGAGFVVLISDRVREKEKIELRSYISGFANTNDAFHQTASSPDGRGSFAAMQAALAMSGIMPAEIDYINLHGTGTINNDLSEGTAVARLFANKQPRVSSTKAFTGHTLAASGGIEAVFSLLALQHQCIFPNLRFENVIPEIGIKPQVKFESETPVRHVMSNSFGFGGNCSSLIFSNAQ